MAPAQSVPQPKTFTELLSFRRARIALVTTRIVDDCRGRFRRSRRARDRAPSGSRPSSRSRFERRRQAASQPPLANARRPALSSPSYGSRGSSTQRCVRVFFAHVASYSVAICDQFLDGVLRKLVKCACRTALATSRLRSNRAAFGAFPYSMARSFVRLMFSPPWRADRREALRRRPVPSRRSRRPHHNFAVDRPEASCAFRDTIVRRRVPRDRRLNAKTVYFFETPASCRL
jgi:hypothetical protein